VLVAAAGAVTTITTFIRWLDRGFNTRDLALQLEIAVVAGLVAVAIVGAVVVSRRSDAPVYGAAWAMQQHTVVSSVPPAGPLGEPAVFTPPQASEEPVSAVGQWAADPYGRHPLRYWDGARWTEHVRTLDGVSATDPI
jgi:hypothetical protein